MKYSIFLFLVIISSAIGIPGQCQAEPVLTPQTEVVITKTFGVTEASEVLMKLAASVADSSWIKTGSEAAVLTVFINGEYNQDVILFAGEKSGNFVYEIALGELPKGSHRIDITLNKDRSAKRVGRVTVADVAIESFSSAKQDVEHIALKHSPFIYARPNSIDRFSDIPLVVYYEVFDVPEEAMRIVYSVIFSHEDGGTKGKALMARWGRMTDIEWIYEMTVDASGNKTSEIFQGLNHVSKPFTGKHAFGSHPIIFNVTNNNNFADVGCSPLRSAPRVVRADLTRGSRETLLERFPWTYRIMSEEIIREGRIGDNLQDADKIFDPREYLYVEIYAEQKDTAISVELDTADGRIVSSDLGIPQLRVARNGYFRIAIRNPTKRLPGLIRLRCHAVGPTAKANCENVKALKVVSLRKNLTPLEGFFDMNPKQIKVGESQPFSPLAK